MSRARRPPHAPGPDAPRRRRRPVITGFAAYMKKIAAELSDEYVVGRGLNAKLVADQACWHLSHLLVPRLRGGSKPRADITKAYEAWRDQQARIRRGELSRVNWLPIAKIAIPDFATLPLDQRGRLLRRLRNAVHNRAHRAARKGRSSPRRTARRLTNKTKTP